MRRAGQELSRSPPRGPLRFAPGDAAVVPRIAFLPFGAWAFSGACAGCASHPGLRHGPGLHTGTHAPSVLWRRTTVSTCCPQEGQTCFLPSMDPA
ncbi:hypothetical protein ACH49_06610 [Streptomyces leeuwenhoekii]|uniref:Uncharacterized protein n=1 Tax=Streptomyces leeuwenhoekii TaxID=1437453 RepID=A0ABR5I2F7_STRLW|nr:hypothetical protein ACH49_06610 [Streptomyces leeuwenhoekii]